MKIKVKENFRYDGKEYESGETVDLPEAVAKSILEKGYGTKEREKAPEIKLEESAPSEEPAESGEKRSPEWKRKLWISEDRNLTVSVWPRGGKFDSPSVTLEESRRNDSGNWETNRTYLPTGSTLVALSENLKSAWSKLQEMKSEENK